VVGVSETEIAAAPEVVWDVLSGIEAWPTWNPEVRAVSMHGGLAEGSDFRWKAGPGNDHPRRSSAWIVLACSPGPARRSASRRLTFTCSGPAAATRSSGARSPTTGSSFASIRGLLQQRLDTALADGLRHLKVEAERRATHQADKRRS